MAATLGAMRGVSLEDQDVYSHQLQNNCVIVTAPKSVIQGKRPLAPATEKNVFGGNNAKRKLQLMGYGAATPQQPASVARRNARERNRVKQVNNGFAALRQHIPPNILAAFGAQENVSRGANKKLSKVETLRMAVEYIKNLQSMLEEHEDDVAAKNAINHQLQEQKLLETIKMEGNRFYVDNSSAVISPQYAAYPVILPTPPSSEASLSPTPSHTSDASSAPSYMVPTNLYINDSHNMVIKNEDEELLDAIFSWQQSE